VAFAVLLLSAATPASALNILINNGLAPPNPANIIDDGTYASDFVRVRNVGCEVFSDAPCISPGAPTTVTIGYVGQSVELDAEAIQVAFPVCEVSTVGHTSIERHLPDCDHFQPGEDDD